MKQVYVKDNEGILLGRVGENEAVQVVWSGVAAEFESAYGKGVFMLTAQRSGDTGAYPCCVDVVDSSVYWTVRAADVARPGYGKVELMYMANETVVYTRSWLTVTLSSVGGNGAVAPSPEQNWVSAVLAASIAAQNSAASAAASEARIAETAVHMPVIRNGYWYIWDNGAWAYVLSGVPAVGKGDTGPTGPAGPKGDPGITTMTQAAYDAAVAAGTIDADTWYGVFEEG